MRDTVRDTAAPAARVGLTRRLVVGLARIVTRVFFARLTVAGRARLPDRPMILAADHVNGVLDPAVVLATMPGPPRFLAAGVLWRPRYLPVRLLVEAAGALPAYRASDHDDPSRNAATLEAVAAALGRGEVVALFPEGEVHPSPGLWPLHTGAARMALQAASRGIDAPVVPVGLVYEGESRFRADAVVLIGTPVSAAPYLDLARRDLRQAGHAMTDAIADGLRHVTVDVAEPADLALVRRAGAVADRASGRRPGLGEADLDVERHLAVAVAEAGNRDRLRRAVDRYDRSIARLGWPARGDPPPLDLPRRADAGFLVSTALLAPVAAIGAVVNAVPALLVYLAGRLTRRPEWKATAKVVAALVAFPVTWAQVAGLARARWGFWPSWLALAGGALGAMAWLAFAERWARLRAVVRSWWERRRHPRLVADARAAERAVARTVQALTGRDR